MKMSSYLIVSTLTIPSLLGFQNMLYAQAVKSQGSVWFVDDRSFDDIEVFMQRHSSTLHLTRSVDGYRPVKRVIDTNGAAHFRVQRTYSGLDVIGCEGWIHVGLNGLVIYGGSIGPELEVDVIPHIGERDAIRTAIGLVEIGIGVRKLDFDSVVTPVSARLVIARADLNLDWTGSNVHLSYAVDVTPLHGKQRTIYVDAITGSVLRLEWFPSNCEDGVAETLYNGSRTIDSKWRGFLSQDYILHDECRGDGIHTYLDGSDVDDGDNLWSLYSERPATSAHWATGMAYDFYLAMYGRNGYNASGGALSVYTSNDNDVDNAGWVSATMTFGGGGIHSTGAWVSLDVVGHEFTHGVTESEADLVYANESGALNESYSDIFGAMVEFYVEGSFGNYQMAEDFYIPDGKLRDMSDPNSKGDPDTYEGDFWYSGSEDLGGVHTNSGVQNFWFYLLSAGGYGVNDNGEDYNVSGIGRNSAAAIAYRALTVYLWSSSSYGDAKNASIYSAIDLFGNCSNEVLQTVNAWNAVGVSSDLGFGANGPVNCAALNTAHNVFVPYTSRVINGMTADCSIIPNGTQVIFLAGEQIELLPGFSSGDQFLAMIDACLAEAKMAEAMLDTIVNAGKRIADGPVTEEPALRIYPNPTTGELTVRVAPGSVEGIQTIRILDISGRLVREMSGLRGETLQFDLGTEQNGTYLIELQSTGSTYRERIVLNQ
jgi:Zn-dependent metalloprotease